MSIEKLKEQARRHEQKEEWIKALDQYKKAIAKLAQDDQPDIGLYNRVGDLYVRVGNLEQAVEHYEQAADLYMEAELANNAIAVCKKIIRNAPNRHKTYLKMGQIRAQQGFLPDARTNFLTYAERVAQAGDMEESLRALDEFTTVAPEDVEVRLFLAEQLASHERPEEAVEHMVQAYQALEEEGREEKAAEVRERILELDPNADLTTPRTRAPADEIMSTDEMVLETGAGFLREDDAIGGEFGEIETGEEEPAEAAAEAAEEQAGAADDLEVEADEEEAEPLPMMEFDDEEEAEPLPMMEFDDEDEDEPLPMMEVDDDEEEGEPLPMMEVDDEEEGPELPLMEEPAGEEGAELAVETAAGEEPEAEDEAEEEVEPLPGMEPDDELELTVTEEVAEAVEEAASAGATELTVEEVEARLEIDPGDISLHQRMVELAYQTGDEEELADAYLGLARALKRKGEGVPSKSAYRQVLSIDPGNEEARAALKEVGSQPTPVKEVAATEDYVDLGAMILGDEEEEKTTRFRVAYEEPSGDEEADFAKMLSQFKDKVSKNLGADDVKAHHDLGTAYKEMGLLDEAIAEFQSALRADRGHLPTYELLGQTFMEMGNPGQAVRSLQRALDAPYEVEDELVGIYYYLARAHELQGNTERALEFYDRVFSLDINFADVTERLRALRPS